MYKIWLYLLILSYTYFLVVNPMTQNWISDNFTWIFQYWKTREEMRWMEARKGDRRIFIRAQPMQQQLFFSVLRSISSPSNVTSRHSQHIFPRSRKYLGAQLLNRLRVGRSRVLQWTNPLNFHAKCKYAIEREERSYVHISGDRLMEVVEETGLFWEKLIHE